MTTVGILAMQGAQGQGLADFLTVGYDCYLYQVDWCVAAQAGLVNGIGLIGTALLSTSEDFDAAFPAVGAFSSPILSRCAVGASGIYQPGVDQISLVPVVNRSVRLGVALRAGQQLFLLVDSNFNTGLSAWCSLIFRTYQRPK